jgi:hypothetical protein
MKYLKLVPLVYICIYSLISLVVAVQPGKLAGLFTENILPYTFFGLLLLIAATVSFVLLLISAVSFAFPKISKRFNHLVPTTVKTNLLALAILFATGFLLYFQVPAKAGFALSYPEFQKAVTTYSDAHYSGEKGKNLGLYKLESAHSNLKNSGGIYFLTFTYYDTITANYGFVYKPFVGQSKTKKPFGANDYVHIFGDWYIFHGATC